MKKLGLLLCVLVSVFILTACGASVSTTTNLKKDGSGTATVTAYANYSDAQYLAGGYEALDLVLENAKPENIELTKVDDVTNSRYIYSFTLEFVSIEDYKTQIEAISGEIPDITWEAFESAFKSNITYIDNTSGDTLIWWAKNAIDAAGISSYKADEMYELSTSYVYLDEEEVWEGYEHPYFDTQTGTSLEKTNIFTTYDINGDATKRIELFFNSEDFAGVDSTKALEELSKYSTSFVFDQSLNCITLDIMDQAMMKQFFDNVSIADENNQTDASIFTNEIEDSSIFTFRYALSENYSIYNLLNEFQIENEYVNNFISIPDTLNYTSEYCSAYDVAQSKEAASYNYQNSFYYNDWYSMEFIAEQSALITEVNVNYDFNKDMSGTLLTTILFEKNGCAIDETKFKEFYKDKSEVITYVENDEQVKATFATDFKEGSFTNDGNSLLQFSKSQLSSLKKKVYAFDSIYDLESYLPSTDITVNYMITIPDNLNLKLAKLDNSNYYGDSIDDLHKNGNYVYSFSSYENASTISLTFVNTNMIYYIIIGAVIVVLIGIGTALLFILRKRKKQK